MLCGFFGPMQGGRSMSINRSGSCGCYEFDFKFNTGTLRIVTEIFHIGLYLSRLYLALMSHVANHRFVTKHVYACCIESQLHVCGQPSLVYLFRNSVDFANTFELIWSSLSVRACSHRSSAWGFWDVVRMGHQVMFAMWELRVCSNAAIMQRAASFPHRSNSTIPRPRIGSRWTSNHILKVARESLAQIHNKNNSSQAATYTNICMLVAHVAHVRFPSHLSSTGNPFKTRPTWVSTSRRPSVREDSKVSRPFSHIWAGLHFVHFMALQAAHI